MRRIILVCFCLSLAVAPAVAAEFKAGFAKKDITPTQPIPMWGYGARHDFPGKETCDPLFAKALVIQANGVKAALVGLDLGRSPTFKSTDAILAAVKQQSGIEFVMMSGSHTHHGPVIELVDEPGKGQGKFDDAVVYAKELEQNIIAVINEAAAGLVDAKIGWGAAETDLNRNRHAKYDPKPRDPELAVVRFDDMQGKTIALMVNMAAHATIFNIRDYRWTSEWPGSMQTFVEQELGTNCFFMQGAEGDLSPNTNKERKGIRGFGRAVADKVKEINQGITASVPANPSVKGIYDNLEFPSRVDFTNGLVIGMFKQGFFPEMLAVMDEVQGNIIRPRLVTVVLNGELALVGGSGEFFCEHSNRLKQESATKETLFVGLCNGHCMYIPTEKAVEQGGYGADPGFAWVPASAGREMIDKALANINILLAQ